MVSGGVRAFWSRRRSCEGSASQILRRFEMGNENDDEGKKCYEFLRSLRLIGEPPPPRFRRTEADTLATVAIHLWRTEVWLPRVLSPAPFSAKGDTASRLTAEGVPIDQVRWSHRGIDY